MVEKETRVTWNVNHPAEESETRRAKFQDLLKELQSKSIRHKIAFLDRKFNVNKLDKDLLRVYGRLEKDFGEEYALTVVFMFRTAEALHKAWHMTLLTSQLLNKLKAKFDVRMTWNLGVFLLKFRFEDGMFELNRKVPYDYDSEFQDSYMKIALALCDGHLNIHQALMYQDDLVDGNNSAKSGLFLRSFPGRLVLYPFQASTCAVIFFNGDWKDAGVAGITGLAAGLLEYLMVTVGGRATGLIDITVGISTGIITSLFYKSFQEEGDGDGICMSSIFLGTLYWFFYGTAFVLGILEIICGELETGVVRFMAVSVKTFVLTLGTTLGMTIILSNPSEDWENQSENCLSGPDSEWWRIPLYLACSASALGQYRMPIAQYWRGLIVQLVGYEVQFQIFKEFSKSHDKDFVDTAVANAAGAIASVLAATLLSHIVDKLRYYYNARVLQSNEGQFSAFGEFMYALNISYVRFSNFLGFGKKNDIEYLNLLEKLKKQSILQENGESIRGQMKLTEEEEDVLLEVVVDSKDINVWSLLMPTVYQLVPGSLIAKLWFNTIFPPPFDTIQETIEGTDYEYTTVNEYQIGGAVFENLMVISVSLAIGLLIGFGVVDALIFVFEMVFGVPKEEGISDSMNDLALKKDMRTINSDFSEYCTKENSQKEDIVEVEDSQKEEIVEVEDDKHCVAPELS